MGGLLDVYYVSPELVTKGSKRHRSRVDVISALGLTSYHKAIKDLNRDELSDMADENREKQLIAYQFDRLNNKCTSITRDKDEITVIPLVPALAPLMSLPSTPAQKIGAVTTTTDDDNIAVTTTNDDAGTIDTTTCVIITTTDKDKMDVVSEGIKVDSKSSTPSDSTVHLMKPKQLYFGYGTTTVLNWGTVSSNSSFHTSTHVYPVGFKCVRQEHDAVLDRAVDCYCEILEQSVKSISIDDEVLNTSSSTHSNHSVNGTTNGSSSDNTSNTANNNDNESTVTTIIPLFRISVCWLLGARAEERCVRVYEGTSPQIAWQAAMLETAGLSEMTAIPAPTDTEHKTETTTDTTITSVEIKSQTETDTEMTLEDMDEEEVELRQRLMAMRKEHMRVLHQAQVIS